MNVSDPVAWYAERYPGIDFGDLVPMTCFYCHGEIAVGDRVMTRKLANGNRDVEPGQRGEVSAIHAEPGFGNIYVLTLESGKRLTVPRAALRKRREGE